MGATSLAQVLVPQKHGCRNPSPGGATTSMAPLSSLLETSPSKARNLVDPLLYDGKNFWFVGGVCLTPTPSRGLLAFTTKCVLGTLASLGGTVEVFLAFRSFPGMRSSSSLGRASVTAPNMLVDGGVKPRGVKKARQLSLSYRPP